MVHCFDNNSNIFFHEVFDGALLIMSSLVIFCIVVIAIVVPKYVAGSTAAKDIDVEKLMELVQQQGINGLVSSDSDESDDSDDSDTSEEDFARTGRVGGENLIDIISQVVNDRNIEQLHYDRKHRKEKPSHVDRIQTYVNRNDNYDSSQHSYAIAKILEQILNKGLKDVDPKLQSSYKRPKKRLTPNRLLGDIKHQNAKDGLEDYSKIYILLNPQALERSKSEKSAVNKLISKILSLSSPPLKKEQPGKLKQRRYKGFAVKDDIQRRRASRENIKEHRKSGNAVYAPSDSVEDKPKRSRNNAGAGHTAIPYIRHRGENIYEKNK